MLSQKHHDDSVKWLAAQIEGLTHERQILTVSEWAEAKRYLPSSVTSMPGPYSFDVAPYLREIADCLSVDSPVRELALRKGAQVAATVGILENALGYLIEHVKSAPSMMVTADAELAKLRMESYITPMLQHSDMTHLIKSSDEKNSRKTGKTDKRMEWIGGGFLVPLGAQNANKMRSISIQYLLRDEIDGWPLVVGRDGDPLKLTTDRTSAFEQTRKIADLSTPLIKGTSKIDQQFARGDQRYYHVRCLKCGFPQPLVWRGENKETRRRYGLVWETENDRLIPGSVRYRCKNCGHAHINDDKTKLLAYDNAEWVPTAEPVLPTIRSYDLNALYSPVGMKTWETIVVSWMEAWDDMANRAKDIGKLQAFYNNELARSFEQRGSKIRFTTVSSHRRREYRLGEIPNQFADTYSSGPIMIVTMAVDVHKDNLAVKVMGWTPGKDRGRGYVIDSWRFNGDCEDLDNPDTWGQIRKLVESREYIADDGKKYRISITLIDAGYNSDLVISFCQEYFAGVYPVLGRDSPSKRQTISEFGEYTTKLGTRGFRVTVDMYKDRWAIGLSKSWDGDSLQPEGHYNAPVDMPDKMLKELTVEQKKARVDRQTNQEIGHFWHRPSGVNNELWDLLMYNTAALDIVAWEWSLNSNGMDQVDWITFWQACEKERLFFEE